MPSVNPQILRWARETAGLSLEKASNAVGIKDAYGLSGVERLTALEVGAKEPTPRILRAMSQKYRRPLLVFYLQSPPRQGDRGQDFRKVPGAQPPIYDGTLDALIRNIKSRQSLVCSLLEDEDRKPLSFIDSADLNTKKAKLIAEITKTLSFSILRFRREQTIQNAFNYLRTCIENAGIFVVLAGNLGSHHSNIPADIFRGFAIADSIAPFVIINDQDARSAWSFTALHEVAHLWLGTTGLSGAAMESRIEFFCNDVAGEILLPTDDLREITFTDTTDQADIVKQITNFASSRNISRGMVAYKLFRTNYLTKSVWCYLNNKFHREWIETRRRKPSRDGKSGGPSYYVIKRHRLGGALLGLISRALGEGTITYTKAGQALDVKPRNVKPLLQEYIPQGGP